MRKAIIFFFMAVGIAASGQDMADVFDKPLCNPLMPMCGTIEAQMPADEPQPFEQAGLYLDDAANYAACAIVIPVIGTLASWLLAEKVNVGAAYVVGGVSALSTLVCTFGFVHCIGQAGMWLQCAAIEQGDVVVDMPRSLRRKPQ